MYNQNSTRRGAVENTACQLHKEVERTCSRIVRFMRQCAEAIAPGFHILLDGTLKSRCRPPLHEWRLPPPTAFEIRWKNTTGLVTNADTDSDGLTDWAETFLGVPIPPTPTRTATNSTTTWN